MLPKVANHMKKVKRPQTKRYHPMKAGVDVGQALEDHDEDQGQPEEPYEMNAVIPKVFPFLNSMMPAMIWAMPP